MQNFIGTPVGTKVPGIKPIDIVHVIQPTFSIEKEKVIGLTLPLISLPPEFAESLSNVDLETVYIPLEPDETYFEVRDESGRNPKIKVGEEMYSLAEYINVRKGRNKEAFDQYDPLIGEIYIRALEENPCLIGVSVKIVDEMQEPRIKDSLGFFDSDLNTIFIPSRKVPRLAEDMLSTSNTKDELYKLFVPQRFKEEAQFKAFISSMSEILEIPEEDTLINIRRITLLHELGHALHLNEYLNENGRDSKSEWDRIGKLERDNMRLWFVSDDGLVTKFQKLGVKVEKVDWEEWRKIVVEYSNRNSRTYRNLSYEAYADVFMASYFAKFRERLLIRRSNT